MRLLVDAQLAPALWEWLGDREGAEARGVEGGEIVAEGTPEAVAKVPRSYTGKYLAPLLERAEVAAE